MTQSAPILQTSLKNFSPQANELSVGDISISKIDKLTGSTPFYAYDRQLIINRVTQLLTSLPKQISVHYAIKANPYPSLVQLMAEHVSGFDVASKKEMLLAIQTGIPVNNISFAGPGKSVDDIEGAIIAGVTLHVESVGEIAKVEVAARALNLKANIAIRVNPKFELKSSGMKMSGGAKPFGIDEEEVPRVLKNLPLEYIKLRGFHIFAGSQNLNAKAIISAQQQTFALAQQLVALSTQVTGVKIDYLNIGGGFGVPYFANEQPLDVALIADNLQTLIQQYASLVDGLELILELGRYLVAEAGIYVCKVVDKKLSRGTTYLVCDGGLHHHLANSGNFGQVIRKNYPLAIGNKLNNKELEQVNIVGPLCTPLDILADKIQLPKANLGDYVVVFQSGAYGASASPKDFLSQPNLREILL
ncbi:pyridoxal-dependent decarboxylase, exosortase A system-associated [Colwellia psychrerythraea]|uniref:Pyridoxal-dependent decarboxylase, exosortase system type 1 associated protein n=1 Tax=Colwellia psychrerythraea TaxID=28229 RepID=A0A099KK32_COLPS|nr:pyridoxal-dependent decarboxylase, exosortase A system-associated [Colwellia psychrerythraea]KGJ91144.1 pyridoxal-dependent decarboxylase, exosortase system type 1 associated protein [Colwellia psychrerythraea]